VFNEANGDRRGHTFALLGRILRCHCFVLYFSILYKLLECLQLIYSKEKKLGHDGVSSG